MSAPWLTSPYLYLPATLAAIAALYLLYFSLLRDRSHARNFKPRCPNCWYDLSGARTEPPITCPECGHKITTPRDLHRTRRRPLLAILALPLLIPLPTLFILRGDARRTYYALPPKWTTIETLRVGETVATLQRLRNPDDRGCRATITSRGKPFLTVEDFGVSFMQYSWYALERDALLGRPIDLDADGILDLVIYAYSGGAHCCYTVYLVRLSDPPLLMATIDARNGMGVQETETSGPFQNHALFNITDQSFDYWNASHVDSAFSNINYRLNNHHLEIAIDRMLRPLTPEQAGRQMSAEHIRTAMSTPTSELEPGLWHAMLDLIYSGNEPQAWDFFNAAWPPTRPGKDAFKQEFLDILNKSPQYRDFQAALAAQAKGEPIPPALVGQYHPQSPADPPPAAPNP